MVQQYDSARKVLGTGIQGNRLVISEATIIEAVRRLQEAAPGSTVVLFGSYARGNPREDSDLDLMVIETDAKARRAEMARLRLALRSLRVPVDVVVVSRAAFESLAEIPGTVYYRARREGRTFDVPA